MKILDVISWLPEKELSIEKIEEIVLSLNNGEQIEDGYLLEMNLPKDLNINVINASEDLISEGRKVCYLIKDCRVIAVVAFWEKLLLYKKCLIISHEIYILILSG